MVVGPVEREPEMQSLAPPIAQPRPLAQVRWISDDAFEACVASGLAKVYDAVDVALGAAAYLELAAGEGELLRGDFKLPSGILWPSAEGSGPVLFAAHRIGRNEVVERIDILDLVVAATDFLPATAVLVTTGCLPAEAAELAERAYRKYGVDLILIDRDDALALTEGQLRPSA